MGSSASTAKRSSPIPVTPGSPGAAWINAVQKTIPGATAPAPPPPAPAATNFGQTTQTANGPVYESRIQRQGFGGGVVGGRDTASSVYTDIRTESQKVADQAAEDEAKQTGQSVAQVKSGTGRNNYGRASTIATTALGLLDNAVTQRRRLLGI